MGFDSHLVLSFLVIVLLLIRSITWGTSQSQRAKWSSMSLIIIPTSAEWQHREGSCYKCDPLRAGGEILEVSVDSSGTLPCCCTSPTLTIKGAHLLFSHSAPQPKCALYLFSPPSSSSVFIETGPFPTSHLYSSAKEASIQWPLFWWVGYMPILNDGASFTKAHADQVSATCYSA